MTAREVEQLVLTEIDGEWERPSSHGIDLKECLVRPPRRETYVKITEHGDIPLRCWLVVAEHPGGTDGYEVFYDEEVASFGLGTFTRDGEERRYIGSYGSLWTTLASM